MAFNFNVTTYRVKNGLSEKNNISPIKFKTTSDGTTLTLSLSKEIVFSSTYDFQ